MNNAKLILLPRGRQLKLTQTQIAQNMLDFEIDHFMLFLENHDGESYNALQKSFTHIFKNLTGIGVVREKDFFSLALPEAVKFVSKHYGFFWSRYCNQRVKFTEHKQEITCVVAYRLAHGSLEEMRLGNFHD